MTNWSRIFRQFWKSQRPLRHYYTYSKEPSMPLDREPEYMSACDALQCALRSKSEVFIHGAAATPVSLVEAMCDVAKGNSLKDIKLCSMHTEGPARYATKEFAGIFKHYSFFMGGNVRKGVAEGYADSVPIFLQDIPLMFYRRIFKPDISLIHVSPPDCHGYCSLGASVDCVRAAIMNSKTIIALVNPQMPRTFGDAIIHESHIDLAVEEDKSILGHDPKPPNDAEIKIGKLIAENLIEDGSTLQMGIGSIPDAVLSALHGHKNLGIHSEMFSDGVIPLIECGVITNHKKKQHKGKIVASFFIGSQKLYKFFDDNPFLEMKVVDYVNKPSVIAKMPKMCAINSCISIDLTGQVNSDSIGTRMFSGFGGQVDFIRGAAIAHDGKGKSIIALQSVTKKGESKIVPILKAGAGVATSRAHVHYVVTEHGIANLFGKSLHQRAFALICIAHPDHRDALFKAALERYHVKPSPD